MTYLTFIARQDAPATSVFDVHNICTVKNLKTSSLLYPDTLVLAIEKYIQIGKPWKQGVRRTFKMVFRDEDNSLDQINEANTRILGFVI